MISETVERPAAAGTVASSPTSTNALKAETTAKSIASAVESMDFLTKKREFYDTTMKRAQVEMERGHYAGVPPETVKKLEEILSSNFEHDEKLRNDWWREINLICIAINQKMSPEEKAEFSKGLMTAKTHEQMMAEDEKWMRWYVENVGISHIPSTVPGHEYFGFFAEKLKENDQHYLSKDWYWDYMFHMVNETARLSVQESASFAH